MRPPASLSFDPHSYFLQEPTKEMEEEPHNPLASSLQAREKRVCVGPSAGSTFSSTCDPTRSLEPWTFSVDDHLTWAGSSQSQIPILNSFFHSPTCKVLPPSTPLALDLRQSHRSLWLTGPSDSQPRLPLPPLPPGTNAYLPLPSYFLESKTSWYLLVGYGGTQPGDNVQPERLHWQPEQAAGGCEAGTSLRPGI